MSRQRDRGAATAELALSLPALMLVVLAGLSALSAVTAQLRCLDSARQAARAASRGDSPSEARAIAITVAPAGAAVAVSREGDRVVVSVGAPVHLLSRVLPPVRVHASAIAEAEPAGTSTEPAR